MALHLMSIVLPFLSFLLLSIPAAAHPTIPSPTGPYRIGRLHVALKDHSRPVDPLAPNVGVQGIDFPDGRYVPVNVYYPTVPCNTTNSTQAPYTTNLAQAAYLDSFFDLPGGSFSKLTTNSFTNVPLRLPKGHPEYEGPEIVLYSPAYALSSIYFSTMHEELASWGYVVIAMDHPYDSDFVNLPCMNTTIMPKYPLLDIDNPDATQAQIEQLAEVRVQDTLFILRSLSDPGSELVRTVGRNMEPTATNRKRRRGEKHTRKARFSQPRRSARVEKRGWGPYTNDTTPPPPPPPPCRTEWWSRYARVAMYGHGTLGGSTATTMLFVHDSVNGTAPGIPQIRGAISLAGGLIPAGINPFPSNTTTRPIMFWAPTNGDKLVDYDILYLSDYVNPTLFDFLNNVGGWISIDLWNMFKSLTFSDLAPLASLLGRPGGPSEGVRTYLGIQPEDGMKAMTEMRKVGKAFFDWVLRADDFGRLVCEGDTEFEGKDVFTYPWRLTDGFF